MQKAEKTAYVEYVLESIKLEMMITMNDCVERDNDSLIDLMIKKLIERRMKKNDLCEVITIECVGDSYERIRNKK